jgi:hypothetical protein
MSESESFLARWSRLKQRSRHDEVTGDDEQPQAHEDATPAPSVDLTTLPDIGNIGPDSDIRPFLQAGVPQELTGAALRSAWVADPSIRDFVEIADNQWDFNAESGIPGFGSLGSADYARNLVARALQGLDDVQPVAPPSNSEVNSAEPPRAAVPGPQIIDEVWKSGAADVPAPGTNTGEARLATQALAAERPAQPAVQRAHGGALPK